MKEAISNDLSSRYQTDALKDVVNITAILDACYKELSFMSGVEIFDDLEQLLIKMHLPCDNGESSKKRNERTVTLQKYLKAQPRGQGAVKMKDFSSKK